MAPEIGTTTSRDTFLIEYQGTVQSTGMVPKTISSKMYVDIDNEIEHLINGTPTFMRKRYG